MGRIVSVNVGRAETMDLGKRVVQTGIRKRPADGPVRLSPEGVAGDVVIDTEHHGGPDQAVYLYTLEDYRWWSQTLGQEVAPGSFGENLLIEGIDTDWAIGDRLVSGDVVLEVSAPRIPCSVLAGAMGDTAFVKRFREARRPGLYLRVLSAGAVQAGDPIRHQPAEGTIAVDEVFEEWFANEHDPERLARALASPLAVRARERLASLLDE